MTEQIQELKAGRELDALVAEKVMGLTGRRIVYRWSDRKARQYPLVAFDPSKNWNIAKNDFGTYVEETGEKVSGYISLPLSYSTDIAAAWEVVERVDNRNSVAKEMGIRRFTLNRYDDSYGASFFNADCIASTAPLAICLAALKAVES